MTHLNITNSNGISSKREKKIVCQIDLQNLRVLKFYLQAGERKKIGSQVLFAGREEKYWAMSASTQWRNPQWAQTQREPDEEQHPNPAQHSTTLTSFVYREIRQ